MFLKSGKKLTIQERYTPMTTFLSPVQKCNHRSFSASSLQTAEKPTFSGSLRDQIRLDSFKKSVLTQSKLNKTALSKATLKVQGEEQTRISEFRNQMSILQLQLRKAKDQIASLINQHHEDILLISRQNQLITQLEKELSITPPKAVMQPQQTGSCECYQSEKYQLVIKNLELKIRHLEEEKKEFKEQIRNLVFKQEQLKHQLRLVDEKCSDEVTQNRRLQDLLYQESRQPQKENKRQKKQTRFGVETIDRKIRSNDPATLEGNDNLRWCQDFLKKGRINQIEKIENILKQ